MKIQSDEYYLKEYVETRGLKPRTYTTMKYALNHYTQFQKATLHELISEADQEEEQGIRWKNRRLKRRLIAYRNHLKNEMSINSAKAYFSKVKGFYNHHEIEIGKLPAWNLKNANVPAPITPEDLPTREIIRQAVEIADPIMRAIILFAVSTGMTRSEILNLKIGDFLTATQEYHQADNIQDALQKLLDYPGEMVPCFESRRVKNNKYIVTFATPEATLEVCNYLLIRDKRNHKYHRPALSNIDQLFKISGNTYIDKFTALNDALNLGKRGHFARLRGHMLRKYNATMLEKYGMSREYVRTLQGKSNGAVDDVYFYVDKSALKKEYLKAIDGVLILSEVKKVNQYSDEYLELKKENEQLREQNRLIEKLEREIENIKKWYI